MSKILRNAYKKYKKMSLPMKASMWFVVCSVIQKGIAFITTPVFTRIMSPDNYGIMTIYSSWLEIIAIFATFQLATGVFNKAMIKYEEDRDGYTSATLVLTSIITMGCVGIYLLNQTYWNSILEISTWYVLAMFIEIFFSMPLSLWSIRNRFEFKYKNVILFTLMVNIVGPLAGILFLLNVSEPQQALAKIWGMVIVKIIVNFYLFFKILKKGKKFIVPKYWKYAMWYNLPLIPHYLSQQVLSQSDRLMISRYDGKAEAGIYGVAYQLSRVSFTFIVAIHQTFTPWTFENIKRKNYSIIRKNAILIEIGIGTTCFFFSLFAPELIYILGGEQYARAVWIVPPVSMSVLFQSIYTFFADIEFYYERTKMVMFASIGVSIVNIILNAIFIPLYGFVAAGYTTMACYMLYSFVHYLFMKFICKQENVTNPYNTKAMWAIAMGFTAASVIVSLLYDFTLLRYLVILFLLCSGSIVFVLNKNKI